jgi:hypothetical protein
VGARRNQKKLVHKVLSGAPSGFPGNEPSIKMSNNASSAYPGFAFRVLVLALFLGRRVDGARLRAKP